jgi:hypothetical protein
MLSNGFHVLLKSIFSMGGSVTESYQVMLELVEIGHVVLHSIQYDTGLLDLPFYDISHRVLEILLHDVDICKCQRQTLYVLDALDGEKTLAQNGSVTAPF